VVPENIHALPKKVLAWTSTLWKFQFSFTISFKNYGVETKAVHSPVFSLEIAELKLLHSSGRHLETCGMQKKFDESTKSSFVLYPRFAHLRDAFTASIVSIARTTLYSTINSTTGKYCSVAFTLNT